MLPKWFCIALLVGAFVEGAFTAYMVYLFMELLT